MGTEQSIKFKEGGMWEFNDWKVVINCECSESGGIVPCKHCHSERIKEHKQDDGSIWLKEKVWICPYVVVVHNESGFNSTGICLDCILEAVEKIKKGG